MNAVVGSEEAKYRSALSESAAQIGLQVDDGVVQRLGQHYTLMRQWAKRINLTTVTEPEAAAVLHGLDCLLFAEFFDLSCKDEVADIGSGAGFPGIVLALARPKLKLCLVEPLRKRTSFLKTALAVLSLSEVTVRQSKLLECTVAPWTTNVIVSRATIPPLNLLKIASPYLSRGGRLILTSGEGAPSSEKRQEAAKLMGYQSFIRRVWTLPGGHTRILEQFTLPG